MSASFEVDNFEQDVLEASSERPVLVDFWAAWCGPCKTLGPRLEALAVEHEDEWTLAKVNIEEHRDVARRYGIRGIPAVKLFADGNVIDEFTGALPRRAIERWLEEALPSESEAHVAKARKAIDAGDSEGAEQHLRAALDVTPTDGEAQVLLARALAFRAPDEAAQLADGADVATPDLLQTKEAVQTITHLLTLDGQADTLPEEEGREAYRQAIEALSSMDLDTALERFIEVIRVNRYYDDDGARKACVALFTLLPGDHPAVTAHRRTFDRSLY